MGELKRRRRLRRKQIEALAASLRASLGAPVFGPEDEVDEALFQGQRVVLVRGEVLALEVEGALFLTVRGLLKYRPEGRAVTVDMGAVPYVYNGADVMAPGIVAADPDLAPGDLCWIRDERNHAPLAVGRALLPGGEMARSREGKAVKTVHHVGDRLWKLGEPG